jgi:hypothetical protein
MRVFGFLGGYAKEEGLATGARYFLLDLAKRAPGCTFLLNEILYGITLAAFAVWIAVRKWPVPRRLLLRAEIERTAA